MSMRIVTLPFVEADRGKEFNLFFSDSSVLLLNVNITNSQRIQFQRMLPLQIYKDLMPLIEVQNPRLSFQVSSPLNDTNHLIVSVRKDASPIFSPLLLLWLYDGSYYLPKWLKAANEPAFDASKFMSLLAVIKTSGLRYAEQDIHEMSFKVSSAGVRTTLRKYQLQGILWMFRYLIGFHQSTRGSMPVVKKTDQEHVENIGEWFPLPQLSTDMTRPQQLGSRNVADGAAAFSQLWYNVISGTIVAREPVSSIKAHRSLILAGMYMPFSHALFCY